MQLQRSKSYPTNSIVVDRLNTYRRDSSSTDIHGFDVTTTVYGNASQESLCVAAMLKHDSDPSKFEKRLPTELSYPGGDGGLSN